MHQFDNRSGRIGLRLVLTLGLVLGALLLCSARYPNMIAGTWFMVRDGGMRETAHMLDFMLYWIPNLDLVEEDPRTGYFTLPSGRADDEFEEAQRLFHLGDFARASDLLSQLIDIEGASEKRLFWLAMAQLRLAEANNCLEALRSGSDGEFAHHLSHQAWCTLPLTRYHPQREWASTAAATWQKLLRDYDPENNLYRWLLNFSYMTIDGYPEAVPAEYRVETAFTDYFYGEPDEADAGTDLSFRDRAAALGVDTFDSGKGVAVEDFDGDGRLDIVTGGTFDPLHYYRNTGERFEDVTAGSGLEGAVQAHLISAADYDNDGRVDLFVASFFQPFRLLRNVDGHRFEDVTEAVGLYDGADEKRTFGWASVWGDVDNDGDLDLYHASWGIRIPLIWGFMGRPRSDSRQCLM